MAELDFTAGITLRSGEVRTVDVEAIDDQGIRYRGQGESESFVPWHEVEAVMLASPDHMLESAGYLMDMSERIRNQEARQPYEAEAVRARALGLLREAAPRICPRGRDCPLAAGPEQGPSDPSASR